MFETYERLDTPVIISTAEGEIYGVGKGSISLMVVGDDKMYEVILTEVIHAPDMDSNLISTTTPLGKGLEVSMHPAKGVNILKNGKIIARTIPNGRLYRLRTIDNHINSFAYSAKREPTTSEPIAYDIGTDVFHIWGRTMS